MKSIAKTSGTIIAILAFALVSYAVAAAQPSPPATPYAIEARPMRESAQIGIAVVSIGILLLISIPGLIWVRNWMFRKEESEN